MNTIRLIFRLILIGLCLLATTACHKNINTTTHGRYRHHREAPPRSSTTDENSNTGRWEKLDIPLEKTDNPELYKELKSWLGTPHRDGMAEKGRGSDCSGMVMKVFLTVYGIPLERNSARIYERNCTPIKRSDLQEGDLVFFNGSKKGTITHVGIYLKQGRFVHTSSSRGVRVSDLTQGYFDRHFECAGRVKQLQQNPSKKR